MKHHDRDFLTRLNLYVDRELSAAERARFEAEVAGDPAKAARLRQYRLLEMAMEANHRRLCAEAARPRAEGEVLWVPRTVGRSRRPARSSLPFTGWVTAAAAAASAAFMALAWWRVATESPSPAEFAQADVAAMVAAGEAADGGPVGIPVRVLGESGLTGLAGGPSGPGGRLSAGLTRGTLAAVVPSAALRAEARARLGRLVGLEEVQAAGLPSPLLVYRATNHGEPAAEFFFAQPVYATPSSLLGGLRGAPSLPATLASYEFRR